MSTFDPTQKSQRIGITRQVIDTERAEDHLFRG
jgi:hypothetical protein